MNGNTYSVDAQQDKRLLMITTGNAATQELVQKFFPEINFGSVYGQRENIPPKPDPKIIEDILKDLKSKPEETLMIGDSSIDMQTSEKDGTTVSVTLPRGSRGVTSEGV